MGRRNIIHPSGTAETSTPYGNTAIDSGGYGDGSLNTVVKGYNDKIFLNGKLWDGPTYVTDQGNCNLPPFVKYPPNIFHKLKNLYENRVSERVLISPDVIYYNTIESESEPHTSTYLPFDVSIDNTVSNTIFIHFMFAEYYGYLYARGYNCAEQVHKFTIRLNGIDYTLNEAITAQLIEPMVLINRGGQGPVNMITSVMNNGEGGNQYGYVGAAYANAGWTSTGDNVAMTAGTYTIFVLKSGVTFSGLSSAKLGWSSNQRCSIEAYYAPTTDIKFTLKAE